MPRHKQKYPRVKNLYPPTINNLNARTTTTHPKTPKSPWPFHTAPKNDGLITLFHRTTLK